jgi:hypothetical protein
VLPLPLPDVRLLSIAGQERHAARGGDGSVAAAAAAALMRIMPGATPHEFATTHPAPLLLVRHAPRLVLLLLGDCASAAQGYARRASASGALQQQGDLAGGARNVPVPRAFPSRCRAQAAGEAATALSCATRTMQLCPARRGSLARGLHFAAQHVLCRYVSRATSAAA